MKTSLAVNRRRVQQKVLLASWQSISRMKLIKPLGPPSYGAYFFDQMPPLFLRLLFEDGVYLAQSFHVCGYYLRVATIRGQHIFDSINSYNAI